MKIVTPGIPKPPAPPQPPCVFTLKCEHCGCVFEVAENEMGFSTPYPPFYFCTCPQNGCGERVYKDIVDFKKAKGAS